MTAKTPAPVDWERDSRKPTTRAEIAAGPAQALFPVQPLNLSRGGALLETGPEDPLVAGLADRLLAGAEGVESVAPARSLSALVEHAS